MQAAGHRRSRGMAWTREDRGRYCRPLLRMSSYESDTMRKAIVLALLSFVMAASVSGCAGASSKETLLPVENGYLSVLGHRFQKEGFWEYTYIRIVFSLDALEGAHSQWSALTKDTPEAEGFFKNLRAKAKSIHGAQGRGILESAKWPSSQTPNVLVWFALLVRNGRVDDNGTMIEAVYEDPYWFFARISRNGPVVVRQELNKDQEDMIRKHFWLLPGHPLLWSIERPHFLMPEQTVASLSEAKDTKLVWFNGSLVAAAHIAPSLLAVPGYGWIGTDPKSPAGRTTQACFLIVPSKSFAYARKDAP